MTMLMLVAVASLLVVSSGCKRKGLDELMEEGKYSEADSYCESVKDDQKAKCYNILATLYFRKDKFDKAAFFYAKAGEHFKVIHSYFRGDFIAEAEAYTRAQEGNIKRNCAGLLAKKLYIYGSLRKSVTYYRMAGQHRIADNIENKIPVFELYSKIKDSLPTFKDPVQRKRIANFNITLKSYIYLDKFLKWPYGRNSEIMKRADALCLDAIKKIEQEAAPEFIENLRSAAENNTWDQRRMEKIAFSHAKLDSLEELIKYIHNIAALRNFLAQNSVVYYGEEGSNDIPLQERSKGASQKALNFDQAFEKALNRGDGVFETINFAAESPGQITLKEYVEDFRIDLGVIDYILSFMQNLETRIKDIQQRSQQYRDTQGGETARKNADRLFWAFVAEGNKALYKVSREEYQAANEQLTSAYETAKKQLKAN